jgi:hypothetical protein
LHGNALLFAIGNHFGPARKFIAEPSIPPRRNDLQIGRKRRGCQLESDLIVALAGSAMGEGIGFFLSGDFDHAFGDERTRDACTQEILAFIECTGLEHRVNEIARKFLLQIDDVAFRSASSLGLCFETFEFLFLADIRAKGDHLGIIFFFDPRQED